MAELKSLNYAQFVESLFKEMDTEKDTLLHAVVGIAGEAGELIDAVKKYWAYNDDLDVKNVKEELGDLIFYVQKVCNMHGWTLSELIQDNREKLGRRFPLGHYSDAQATARADKKMVLRGDVWHEEDSN